MALYRVDLSLKLEFKKKKDAKDVQMRKIICCRREDQIRRRGLIRKYQIKLRLSTNLMRIHHFHLAHCATLGKINNQKDLKQALFDQWPASGQRASKGMREIPTGIRCAPSSADTLTMLTFL